jgi:hypothetical protein
MGARINVTANSLALSNNEAVKAALANFKYEISCSAVGDKIKTSDVHSGRSGTEALKLLCAVVVLRAHFSCRL